MEDASGSRGATDPVERGGRNAAEPPGIDDPALESDDAPASTVLAEVLPGVAVVFGKVPAELKLDLIDFGLISPADRKQLTTALASIGHTATLGGNLAIAVNSAQGLYRLDAATQALMKAGATLAVKDGASIGALMRNGKVVAQARLIPVSAMSTAQAAATIGPVIGMIALQMSLNEITGLVRTNIALTNQVLTTIRHEQWAELTGLCTSIERVVDQARKVESVPATLWDNVAGNEALLDKQRDLYQRNVGRHIQRLEQLDARGRREYMETNAEAILFDAYALLTAVKAWTEYQALRVARARSTGDADEARLAEVIAHDTPKEFQSIRAETTNLIDALTRELRIIAELPGRRAMPLTQKRKDVEAVRLTCAQLLEVIEPLADVLRPTAAAFEAPAVVCAPKALDHEPYLRILQWMLTDGEILRCLGFPDQPDVLGAVVNTGANVLGRLGSPKSTPDKTPADTLVAVTTRRVITARLNAFRQHGEIAQDIPIGHVRYVRTAATQDSTAYSTIDLITRDENLRWRFTPDTDHTHVDALAAVLAQAMTIPSAERDALTRRGHELVTGPTHDETRAIES